MWPRLLMSVCLAVLFLTPAWAEEPATEEEAVEEEVVVQEQTRTYTLFVVRHAEKQDGDLDPALTREGYRRAVGLSQMLTHADIGAIYSTYYRRTMGTALPLARELSLPLQFYKADEAEALLEKLAAEGTNALVVGHSNTVPALVNSAGGQAPDLTEDDYGDVFLLTVRGDEVITTRLAAPLLEKD